MSAIRLIGQNHATHHEGAVLSIADERTAMTNRNTVTLEHAHVLVERGEAEWVGLPPGGHEAEEERRGAEQGVFGGGDE